MMYFFCFLGGWIVGGVIISLLVTKFGTSGILRIDHSNPEKDKYLFEIDDLDSLDNLKRIILKIDHHADLSQN